MPSSSFLQAVVGQEPIGTSFSTFHSFKPCSPLIGPSSECAIGNELTAMGPSTNLASTTYPAANRSIGYPFVLGTSFLVRKFWWQSGTTGGTDIVDVGVYDEAGTKLVSCATPPTMGTANLLQENDCTDTVLLPGRYWLVYAQSGVTATPIAMAYPAALCRTVGMAQMANGMSGNALVATFTPAAVASAYVPWAGIAGRTQVA